ncbi:hypothetical protein [uncultured Roseobacter sp.]|uniref:hypothetical protein n=1 Tax=uncultured Roseobacter sp. TaxID=114847 RepID=UPI00260FFAC9|nr:hypothetical protein [uncultured Roseobacter sp.]
MKNVIFALFVVAAPALAEPPQIDNVKAIRSGDTWRFEVTISHPDTGWDHYADAWRVLDMQGNQIAIRELAHPHVQEQPFTRSLSGVRLPEGTTQVQIQARDLPGGWNPTATIVTLR